MPRLLPFPELTITTNSNYVNTVDVKVIATVMYSDLERCMARLCRRVTIGYLRCEIFGKDFLTADDLLFSFVAIPIYVSTSGIASYTFFISVPSSFLNENPVGKDKIYAKVILFNDLAIWIESRNSLVIIGHFP